MSIIEIKVTLQDIDARCHPHPRCLPISGWTAAPDPAGGHGLDQLASLHVPARATWGIADPDFGGEDLPANKTTLGQVIATGKKTINYIYDFGDNWEHRIKIGRITDPVPGELYPN